MISLDYTIAYQVIIFVVLWVILEKILFRPYLTLLEERERLTAGAHDETSALLDEGERLKAQYGEAISQARASGSAAKEAILQDARQRCDKILAQAREQATHSLAQVRQEIHSQLEKERQLAATEGVTIAQQIVSKILGRNVA